MHCSPSLHARRKADLTHRPHSRNARVQRRSFASVVRACQLCLCPYTFAAARAAPMTRRSHSHVEDVDAMPRKEAKKADTCVKSTTDICERATTLSSARSADTATACLSGEPVAAAQPVQVRIKQMDIIFATGSDIERRVPRRRRLRSIQTSEHCRFVHAGATGGCALWSSRPAMSANHSCSGHCL